MIFSYEALIVYLFGSMLFCWVASWMAVPEPSPQPEIKKPGAQKIAAPAVFAAVFGLSIAARLYAKSLEPAQKTVVDLAFAGFMIVAAAAAAAAMRDSIRSVGLSLRGIRNAVFFLVPPLGLVFMPGHLVNLKTLAVGIAPAIAVAGLAEELFFRGWLQTRLQALFGAAPGLLFAAAAYTIFRLPLIWGVFTLPAFIVNIAVTFLVWGCAAGIIYRRSGSIYGLVILHIFWDTAVKVFTGLAIE